MATAKALKATASYEKDTAKGKHRIRVEGKGVAGTLYLEGNLAAEDFDITITPKVEE